MPGRPFKKGFDPRRGRGPEQGAPNAGRPRSRFKEECRELLVADGIMFLREVMTDPERSTADRLRAVELVARYGLGRPQAEEFDTDQPTGVVILSSALRQRQQ